MFYNLFCKFSFIYIKASKNLSAKYYQENKDRLQKKANERYQNFSNKEKEKKQQYDCDCERYKNLSEDEKSKLVEYRKNIIK